jgi:hypothetical protein
LRFQEIHLIGENVLVREVEKLVAIRYERNRYQLHAGFLWSLSRFSMITALARGNHIGPAIGATA